MVFYQAPCVLCFVHVSFHHFHVALFFFSKKGKERIKVGHKFLV